ncbi:sodium/proton-translocating pyrophosphatase, partial [Escherichia coli]|nr:sodium/proton-translocating pyrophosphatase [Escherichia coli]
TGLTSIVALYFVTDALVPGAVTAGDFTFSAMDLFWCGVVGLLVTAAIVVITEYYTGTGFRPVKSVAKASVSGHGTNVIQGLAMSLESTALPA